MNDYRIRREGYYFRAIHVPTGTKSQAFTSPSQAGLFIQRKAGVQAYGAAFAEWVDDEARRRNAATVD